MTKELLDLHCAHGKPVTCRCRQCEHDVHMGKGSGFTRPQDEQAPSKEKSPMQELREIVENQSADRRFMPFDLDLIRRVVAVHEPCERQCNHGAVSPKGTMFYHGYVRPHPNLWRCDVCHGLYEGNLTDPEKPGEQGLTLYAPGLDVDGPSPPPGLWQPIETTPPTDRNNPVYVAYPHFKEGNKTLIPDEYICFTAYCDNLGWDTGFWRLHEMPHYWHSLPSAPTTKRDGLKIKRPSLTKGESHG